MTNPTERPEERDSVEAVVRRFDATPKQLRDGQVYKDLRTLINEVKERDRFHAESERQLRKWQDRTAQAEAEVKELREENAGLHASMDRRAYIIKQMEEALREARRSAFAIAEMADGKGQVFLKRMADELYDQIDHHVAALSPSDTEEEA